MGNLEQFVNIFAGTLGVVGILIVIFFSILWAIFPFLVFGIKSRLDKVILELRQMNSTLSIIADREIVKGGDDIQI